MRTLYTFLWALFLIAILGLIPEIVPAQGSGPGMGSGQGYAIQGYTGTTGDTGGQSNAPGQGYGGYGGPAGQGGAPTGTSGQGGQSGAPGQTYGEVQAARVMEIRATEDNLRVRIMEAVQRAFRVKAGPM